MIIGGLERLSLLDYPGKLAAIVFTAGCNFRCRYCYNPMFVLPQRVADSAQSEGRPAVTVDDLLAFLRQRRSKLEAVVVTGGEPTLQPDLPEYLARVKALGYLIKLDTNGTNPEMLERLLAERLVDYWAMDVKAPWAKYKRVTQVAWPWQKLAESVKIIKDSSRPYEFRTTVVPRLLSGDDILAIAEQLKPVKRWYLQNFMANPDLVDPGLATEPAYPLAELKKIAQSAARIAGHCVVRYGD